MLTAGDIMTKSVITVDREMSIQEVADLLVVQRISAVPVLDNNHLVGVVSEDDLLHRAEIDTQRPRRPWWLAILTNNDRIAREYVLAHATHVGDVMAIDVPTISRHMSLPEIADLFDGSEKKWFPVIENGTVVGIVSRRDFVRALANTRRSPWAQLPRNDINVRDEILEALWQESWKIADTSRVDVKDGLVTFSGTYRSEAERKATVVLAENVRGVRGVDDRRIFMDWSFAVY